MLSTLEIGLYSGAAIDERDDNEECITTMILIKNKFKFSIITGNLSIEWLL
jgi:hypothetical protein